MCGAAAFVWSAALPAAEPIDDVGAPLLELLGDNEVANPIINGILEIGGDVMDFLIRTIPEI
jgi:hypothetical protein